MTIYTDGSALAYCNCGGWAYVREDGRARSGAVEHAGSNQMELWAVLEAIASLPRKGAVVIYTDSKYVIDGSHGGKSGELWEEFYLWQQIHEIKLLKVRSHPSHTKAHHLAREAVFALQSKSTVIERVTSRSSKTRRKKRSRKSSQSWF